MNSQNWNELIAQLSNPHLLQTKQWAIAKEPFGWQAHYKTWQQDGKLAAAAQILERQVSVPGLKAGFRMHYVPKGPTLANWHDAELRGRVTEDLREFANERGAFFVKIDPDVSYGYGLPGEEGNQDGSLGAEFTQQLAVLGWRFSNEQVQMRNTMLIDVSKSDEELLAAMKQKTRYNLRLAERKGVTVRQGNAADFPTLFKMYAETSVRDRFVIRSEEYYRTVWDEFFTAGMMVPLIAEVEGQSVAGLMLFVFEKQSWYLYGMSRALYREHMPNYLLQWHAIKLSKERGCETYDLWGAPDEFNENDPMWGVYRFKTGLGAYEARRIGAWDLPLDRLSYSLYTQVLPKLTALMKWRGRRSVRSQVLAGEPG
jgi:lipid II:glycine glycyltransferase (peptidoglycan interpeptide bridge formation enzyme)